MKDQQNRQVTFYDLDFLLKCAVAGGIISLVGFILKAVAYIYIAWFWK